jgi:hypothetical protein
VANKDEINDKHVDAVNEAAKNIFDELDEKKARRGNPPGTKFTDPPAAERCIAKKEDGEQCPKWRRKGGFLCCYSHRKFEETINPNMPSEEELKGPALGRLTLDEVDMKTKGGVLVLLDFLAKDIVCNKSKFTGLQRQRIMDIAKVSVSLMSQEEKDTVVATTQATAEMEEIAKKIAESDIDPILKVIQIGNLVGHDQVHKYVTTEIQPPEIPEILSFEQIQGASAPMPSFGDGDDDDDEGDAVQAPARIHPFVEDVDGEEVPSIEVPEPKIGLAPEPEPEPEPEKEITIQDMIDAYRAKMSGNFQSPIQLEAELETGMASGMDPKIFLEKLRTSRLNGVPIKSIIRSAIKEG